MTEHLNKQEGQKNSPPKRVWMQTPPEGAFFPSLPRSVYRVELGSGVPLRTVRGAASVTSQGARVWGARGRGLSSRNRSGARVLQDEAASGVATDQWRLSGRTEGAKSGEGLALG